MKYILPLLLILIGYLGGQFFANYHGHMIPHPGLLYLLSWVFRLGGMLIIAFQWVGYYMDKPKVSRATQARIDRLKSSGEKIRVHFDDCEFKGSDYQEEVADDSKARSYDVLFNQSTTVQTVSTSESALVYRHKSGDTVERFQSPVYPISDIGLKAQILKGDLYLYVDRFDRSNYYFELTTS